MSFASLLIHTCDISTLTQGAQDAYGKRDETWPITYPTTACRLMSTGGREVKVGADVVVSDWKLFVDIAIGIDEQDKVSNIQEGGIVIDASTYEVLLVQPRSNGVTGHHRECFLQKVV